MILKYMYSRGELLTRAAVIKHVDEENNAVKHQAALKGLKTEHLAFFQLQNDYILQTSRWNIQRKINSVPVWLIIFKLNNKTMETPSDWVPPV